MTHSHKETQYIKANKMVLNNSVITVQFYLNYNTTNLYYMHVTCHVHVMHLQTEYVNKDIIETNHLTKFHKDQKISWRLDNLINVASRV